MQLSNTMYEIAGCYTNDTSVNLAILTMIAALYLILKALWRRADA